MARKLKKFAIAIIDEIVVLADLCHFASLRDTHVHYKIVYTPANGLDEMSERLDQYPINPPTTTETYIQIYVAHHDAARFFCWTQRSNTQPWFQAAQPVL